MFSDMLADAATLIFPRRCPVCGGAMARGGMVCTLCELTAPLTGLWSEAGNGMAQRFWGMLPVEHASAFLWYVEGSPWRAAVHRFKYGGEWRTAYSLGRWYGALMKESGLYDGVDVAVPVPLHYRRLLGRGYNQAEYVAEGIARELGIGVDRTGVRRHRYNRSQTTRSKHERWDNVEGIFSVRRPEALAGRHLLLVDDVFTTGATVMSLGSAIIEAVPDVRLSVAVLAATRRSAGQEP